MTTTIIHYLDDFIANYLDSLHETSVPDIIAHIANENGMLWCQVEGVVRTHLTDLVRGGRIIRTRRGFYSLPKGKMGK